MAHYPVEQYEGDSIQCRGRALAAERGKETIYRAMDGDVTAIGIMTDGYRSEQDSENSAEQIERQRVHAERLKELAPAAFLALDIDKVYKHSLDTHRHTAGNQDKRR